MRGIAHAQAGQKVPRFHKYSVIRFESGAGFVFAIVFDPATSSYTLEFTELTRIKSYNEQNGFR